MGVEYRVLGRLEVLRDGVPLDLGAFRQRALLGLLLANAGTVLSTDRILDELWGEASGIDKQNSLWVYVSGLRGVLDPGRAKRSEGTLLLTRAPGYVVMIGSDDTDAGRFERAVADARAMVVADPAGASHTLRTALAMWRGHAYEEFVYESWAQSEIARLEELRLQAVEDRIDTDLRLGLDRELISELQSLARQHPLRERFVSSLMLALYRSGRAAEALRAGASFRSHLVQETGMEPSRTLRDLEHQILDDDPNLLVDAEPGGGPQRLRLGLTVRGYELREELGRGTFGAVFRAYQPVIGREVAIKVITPALADDPAFIRRFEAEAQLVARLEHPHIIPLYDYWREPGAAYLVMRLMETGTLADVLAGGGLPADRASKVFSQIASALRSAHRGGVVHRDVTPENILIDRDGNAYLSDFGVALLPDLDRRPAGNASPSPSERYIAPEARAGRPPSPASDIYSFAVVAATALTSLSGDYDQLRGALTPAVRTVLDRATATDPARRYSDAAAFGRALVEALGVPEVPLIDDSIIDNPYKGLRAFGVADAEEFFGRERLVERLVARLGEPGVRGRFVAVVGPSGSGKSSVVRAGLLPALANGALPMSADWFRTEMTPAPHPFEQLAAALLRVARETPNALVDVLLAPGGAHNAVRRVLPNGPEQLLLVIDQFEELFTQVDEDTANRFIDELVDLVTAAGTRVRVVITLRADFYDRPLQHRGLGELLRAGTEVVTPMSVDELEEAITAPTAKVDVHVAPQVVSEMVAEIVDRPGALPLLQYTLTELFEARAGRTITLASYRAGGGVSRALARRADSLLEGFGPATTATARHVLLRLVSLDDDGGSETRRRALVAELEDLDGRGPVRKVLETFGRHRLLSFDRDPVTRGPTVEISHEAMLTEWKTLRAWISDAHDDLRTHRHLVGEINAWEAADRSPDYLLRGARLEAIAAWADLTTIGLRPVEREFLEASLVARERERRERHEEQRRRTDAERRAQRRTRQLLVAALATALIAGLAGLAWTQRQDARQAEQDRAGMQEAQRLANVSVTTLDKDPEVSLLLAMEAVRATADLGYAVPEAIDATHWALQKLGVQYNVTPTTPTAARFGPGGVRGVWTLPVEELMTLAEQHTDRVLTADECGLYLGSDCPAPKSVAGVEYLGGVDAYAAAVAPEEAEVVIAVSAGLDAQTEEWQRNLDVISERYGIRFRLRQFPLNLSVNEAIDQGIDADLFHFTGPGGLRELAASRPLLDLRPFIDEKTLIKDYGSYLVSLSRVGDTGTWPSDTGPIHGVWAGADSKALVWTREPQFTNFGYRPPTDWSSFTALADQIVADGRTPFCLELATPGADGWPATDWVEMVVLRAGGPKFYDAWIRHEVPFDHPVVVDAIRTIGEMVHRPGYLDASPAATSLRDFGDALLGFTGQPPACLMTPFPSYMPGVLEAGAEVSAGSFGFPTFRPGYDDAVVGGGGMIVAITDRPEVRAFMSALASSDWGIGATQLEWPLLLPVNASFDGRNVANPVMGEIITDLQDAIRSDSFRFDASDTMPTEVAPVFLAGMVRLFREGSLESLDQLSLDIAQDVEATWREFEATTGNQIDHERAGRRPER
jgi:DNA-binding SARP family transcriptional activator/ABC-type glycerol-3-phosphate transport system substrate-binding protein